MSAVKDDDFTPIECLLGSQTGKIWVQFPTTHEKIQYVLDILEVTQLKDLVILDAVFLFSTNNFNLSLHEDIREINLLAQNIQNLNKGDGLLQVFEALVETRAINSISDLITISIQDNIDIAYLYPDVHDDYELGMYMCNEFPAEVEELGFDVKSESDFTEIGKAIKEKDCGEYSSYGYIMKSGPFIEYNKEQLTASFLSSLDKDINLTEQAKLSLDNVTSIKSCVPDKDKLCARQTSKLLCKR